MSTQACQPKHAETLISYPEAWTLHACFCRFSKAPSGTKIQELALGRGPAAENGKRVSIDFVLRRSNGYFIYSTVEGVSFQPRDIPTGPFDFKLVRAVHWSFWQ